MVVKILQAFTYPEEIRNQGFNALNDFNVTNAYPLIGLEDDKYLLFLNYNLAESFYESPFYWMNEDENYLNEASKNRGAFLEEFAAERLELVFSKYRVFSNIEITN